MDSVSSDEVYQDQILPHVSRTFALTIPQLPVGLRTAVTNAYLLCRIADTIEDEPALSPAEVLAFLQRFSAVLAGRGAPGPLAREIALRLSDRTLAAERELVSNMERVIRVMARFNEPQRAAIQRCVELMCFGMPRFQFTASLNGLAASSDLDDYCYYVAGVVGEMLTELFCDYSPEIARHRPALSALAASFAQRGADDEYPQGRVGGPQPRRLLAATGCICPPWSCTLAQVSSEPFDPRFGAGLRELVGVAHAHLRNALDYTLLIPSHESGIRRFCLWAIGLAVLTLRKIERNPRFTAGAEVKVSRSAVAMTRLFTDAAGRSDRMLRLLFALAARSLPLARLSELRRPAAAPQPVPEPQHTFRRSYGNSGS